MSASAYGATSTEEVLRGLDRDGISRLRISELINSVPRQELKALIRYGLGGCAIFQGDARDDEGNRIEEVKKGKQTGFVESDYGTYQRMQRLLPDGKESSLLRNFRGGCLASALLVLLPCWSIRCLSMSCLYMCNPL